MWVWCVPECQLICVSACLHGNARCNRE
jgi:hypothetical protein